MNKQQLNRIASASLMLGLAPTVATTLTPDSADACACGCGVFDVGTSSMFPGGSGGMAFLNYDYQDQNQNWSGNSSAPGNQNGDKEIETHFAAIGLQYMVNRSWGAQLELPVWNRTFTTDVNFGSGHSDVVSKNWAGLGDIRVKGLYTGFSEDLSSGLTFGAKLPTGSYSHDPGVVDRDTQIGTGSTDVLLGAFHRSRLGKSRWNWFGQAELELPVIKSGSYRPGLEVDAAAGIYYDGISWGRVKISPVMQVIGSWRGRDNGSDANPDDSGYQRVLLSPGIEFHLHPVKIYADVEIPTYQNMNGNQLVAPALVKISLSYMF